MSVRAEAMAAKALDGAAKMFVCSKPCVKCGSDTRYLSGGFDCVQCQRLISTARNQRKREGKEVINPLRESEMRERLARAVKYLQTMHVSVNKAARLAKVGVISLKRELERLGLDVPKVNPAVKTAKNQQGVYVQFYGLGASGDLRKEEFAAAAPSMMAMALFDQAYREHHPQEAA